MLRTSPGSPSELSQEPADLRGIDGWAHAETISFAPTGTSGIFRALIPDHGREKMPRHMGDWHEVRRVELDVPQASGVVAIDSGVFLVVDDDLGVFVAYEDGSAQMLAARKDHRELRDLEGICLGPDGSAWVLSERTSAVHSLGIERGEDGVALGAPELVGELEHIARKSNKGWEGIEVSGGHALACHEGKPRRVGVFSLADLSVLAVLKLPKRAEKALSDFSDLTVDPSTGRVLLLSDESACFAELDVHLEDDVPAELSLHSVVDLDLGKKEKAEGICFDAFGVLWLVTDGDPHLRAFERS